MKQKIRIIAALLSVIMLLSVLSIISVSAVSKTATSTRPVITDVVNSDPEIQVGTKRYYFYMPSYWYNEKNDNYDGESLDSCAAGIYWWGGSYKCADYKGECAQEWPGFLILNNLADEGFPNIFYADVPDDVETLIFNNTVDGGQDESAPGWGYNYQTMNINTQYTYGDDYYEFYESLDSTDGMIYVVNPRGTTVSELSGTTTERGDWFYYYGNGEYGYTPEKGSAVYKNGDFPKYFNISDTAIYNYLDYDPSYTIYCSEAPQNITVTSDDESVATVSAVTLFANSDAWKSQVTVTGVAAGSTTVNFEYTDPDDGNKTVAKCSVEVMESKIHSPNNIPSGNSDCIYFDVKGWRSCSKVYCHIYQIGGDSFFNWQTPAEECKKVQSSIYSYDLSKLSESTKLSGMKSGGSYAVIFSTDTGLSTYDATIGVECKGDMVYLTGNQVENPIDSNKKGDEAKWENNSSKYGPHLALTSIGNIVGEKLAPGETGIQVIADWTSQYFRSTYCDPVNVLAAAYPEFGIKTVDDLTRAYAFAMSKVENGDYSTVSKEDLPDIKKVMEDAFNKAYPSQKGKETIDEKKEDEAVDKIEPKTSIAKWTVKGIKNKSYTGKAIKQKITVVKGSKKATFKVKYSNNKNAGKAKMVITGTGDYNGTINKMFKINKAANPVKVTTALKSVNHNVAKYTSCTLSPISVKKAQGKVTCKKVSGSKVLTVKSNGKVIVKKGCKKGLYTAKVKITAKGTKNYKSKSKTVKIKIVVY